MANSIIPLSSPEGVIYAYACGLCHRVHSGTIFKENDESEVAIELKFSQENAEECCKCRSCDKVKRGLFICDECVAKQEAEWEAEEVPRKAARDQALAKSKDKDAALALNSLMSEISEDHYCAGWLGGLEYDLWKIVQGGNREFGFGDIAESRVTELKRLSEKAGGWWYYDEENGETFIPMDAWIAMFSREKQIND